MRTYFKLAFSMFLFFAFAVTTNAQQEQFGQASYYSDAYHGKKTASGIKYNKNKFTCAHNDYPFGSELKVTHLENKKSVIVKVIDRGPYIKGRIVDLSRAAAQKIGLVKDGVAQVKVELVKSGSGKVETLTSKGSATPDEYSTAPKRKKIEETIKKGNARAASASPKKTAKTAAKKATKIPAKTTAAKAKKEVAKKDAAKNAAKEVAKKDTATKGALGAAALPMLTAKDFKNADLYQISLKKPKKEGYGVQVASLSDYENVLKKVAELQGKWFQNILISTEKAGGESVYKIILGQFETRKIAERYKKDLKKKKKISGFVVALGKETNK
ncbi:MAG TPA: septal ring lytic transglycosylase RlpA family protein [Phaeodactylibacter sp.]|nr:septal ring lytic transglycosylase RlpA family protein [Phaeodactylibacter sp.]